MSDFIENTLSQGDVYRGFKLNRVFFNKTKKVEIVCRCGALQVRTLHNMKKRGTKGCDRCVIKHVSNSKKSHGMSWHPLYHTYRGMIHRCTNPSNSNYFRYGGRGIKVCKRWTDSFNNFLNDIGDKPTPLHTLDRKDNDGNYEPDNCKWSTQKEQCNNFSANHIIRYEGVDYTLTQFSELLGIKQNTLTYRVKRGWSIRECVKGKRDTSFKIPYGMDQHTFIKMLSKAYEDRHTTKEVADIFGVSASNLSRILRRDSTLEYWERFRDGEN